ASSASLASVTMTVPAGTGGTPTVGTVSPAGIAGGSVSLVGTTLTYSFTTATVAANTAASIRINGITHSATPPTSPPPTPPPPPQIPPAPSPAAIVPASAGPVPLAGGALTSLGWSASSTTVGASASYTYTFTAGLSVITSVTMTVPPGTTGTPTLGTVSPGTL